MKKLVLALSILIGVQLTQAQGKNQTYHLFYSNNKLTVIFPTGMYFRNDTLYIDLKAGVNVIAVQNEGDSIRRTLLLKDMREKGPVCMFRAQSICFGLINDSLPSYVRPVSPSKPKFINKWGPYGMSKPTTKWVDVSGPNFPTSNKKP